MAPNFIKLQNSRKKEGNFTCQVNLTTYGHEREIWIRKLDLQNRCRPPPYHFQNQDRCPALESNLYLNQLQGCVGRHARSRCCPYRLP